jgi:hypothetical protein
MAKNKSFDPPFNAVDKALLRFVKDAGWKNSIPFILKWIENHQPNDTAYNLEFWLKQNKIIQKEVK